jgi:hypothetical protein
MSDLFSTMTFLHLLLVVIFCVKVCHLVPHFASRILKRMSTVSSVIAVNAGRIDMSVSYCL